MEGAPKPWDSCSGQWCSPHLWRDLKATWMWHLGTWVNFGLSSAGCMVGLDECRGLFLKDSVILCWSRVEMLCA